MPSFIKTKEQEKNWKKAKKAVAKLKKPESKFEDKEWATVNSVYQKMPGKKPKKK